MNDYITSAINRINEFLPTRMGLANISSTTHKSLPFALSRAFDYREADVEGLHFLIAGVGGYEDEISPAVLSRQRDILEKATGLTVIFIFKQLKSFIFARYTKKNLNIVVGDRHLFLPSLLLVVGKNQTPTSIDSKITSAAQMLILYHLEVESVDGMNMQQIAWRLRVSYASINRALRWLVEHNFINLKGNKEKSITFRLQGKSLWEESLPYMFSPVETTLHVSNEHFRSSGLVSGEAALAQYSLLVSNVDCRAISKEEYKFLRICGLCTEPFGETEIQVWRYDPTVLSTTGIVDKLSLYLMLKDNDDERVQIELNSMMETVL